MMTDLTEVWSSPVMRHPEILSTRRRSVSCDVGLQRQGTSPQLDLDNTSFDLQKFQFQKIVRLLKWPL